MLPLEFPLWKFSGERIRSRVKVNIEHQLLHLALLFCCALPCVASGKLNEEDNQTPMPPDGGMRCKGSPPGRSWSSKPDLRADADGYDAGFPHRRGGAGDLSVNGWRPPRARPQTHRV